MSEYIIAESAPKVPTRINREEAQARGLLHYFTGAPCIRGHVAERYASSGVCVVCACDKRPEEKRRAVDRRREYRAANREAYRAQERERNKTRVRLQTDATRAYAAEYRARNAEQLRRLQTEWCKDNPERVAVIRRNRRSRKKNAEGTHTASDIKFLHIMQNGQCAACTLEFTITGYHVDHIIPLARGGSNWPENLQLLCPSCNSSKGTKLMAEWVATRGW